jgi:hypothetical protein
MILLAFDVDSVQDRKLLLIENEIPSFAFLEDLFIPTDLLIF